MVVEDFFCNACNALLNARKETGPPPALALARSKNRRKIRNRCESFLDVVGSGDIIVVGVGVVLRKNSGDEGFG